MLFTGAWVSYFMFTSTFPPFADFSVVFPFSFQEFHGFTCWSLRPGLPHASLKGI